MNIFILFSIYTLADFIMFDEFILKPVKNKKLFLFFLFSCFLSSYVLFWLSIRLDPGIPLQLIYLSFFISSFIGYSLSLSELRFSAIIIIFSLIVFLLYFLCFYSIKLYSNYINEISFLNYHYNHYFTFLSIIAAASLVMNYLLFKWKYFIYFQSLLYLSVIISIFSVHRNYHLSRLDLFSIINISEISDLMLFFIFIFILFLFLTLHFYFDERKKENNHSGKINFKAAIKSLLALFVLFFIVGLFLRSYVENKEPILSGGLKLQFDEKEFLDLYPSVTMNPKERKAIAKISVQQKVNYIGKRIPIDYQYIKWKVLSGYHPQKNLFYHEKSPFENNFNTRFIQSKISKSEMEANSWILQNQEYYTINFHSDAKLYQGIPQAIYNIKNKKKATFTDSYRVESLIFNGPVKDLDKHIKKSRNQSFYDYYTKSPNSKKYKILAKKLTQNHTNLRKKMEALIHYFNNNYSYSLNPGGENRKDRLSYFLFNNKKGYCSYFAFSMAALARSIDIPARVIVGFITDPENKVENYYLLHASNMHAWIEVYFEGYGWIPFDPTPSTGVRNQMKPDKEYLYNLVTALEKDSIDMPLPKGTQIKQEEKAIKHSTNWNYFILLLPLSILFIPLIKLLFLLKINSTTEPYQKILLSYQYSIKKLKDYGIKKKPGETEIGFAERVYKEYSISLLELTELYVQARYSNNNSNLFISNVDNYLNKFNISLSNHKLSNRLLNSFKLSFFF